MDASDWVTSVIAPAALVVSILAVGISWRAAKAAEESAEASESSADTAARQHATELARDGIVEFGPWRAESSASAGWKLINMGDVPLYNVSFDSDDEYKWDVVGGAAVGPRRAADVTMPGGAQYTSDCSGTFTWNVGSNEGSRRSEYVRLKQRARF